MSYRKCVYYNCDNTSLEISMFRFPVNDKGRLLLWIRNSGNTCLDSLTSNELSWRYICAAHFDPSSINHGNTRKRLIGPAIPIHFQSTEVKEGTSSSSMAHVATETGVPSSPEVLKVKTPTKFYSKHMRTISEDPSSTLSSESSHNNKSLYPASPTKRLSRKCLFEGPKKRLSRKCLFEQNKDDTPKKTQLKYTASNLLKKNNALRAQLRRLREKSTKKLNEGDQFRSEVSKTLAMMQLRKPNNNKKWSAEEKKFCMSFFYKSPSAYTGWSKM